MSELAKNKKKEPLSVFSEILQIAVRPNIILIVHSGIVNSQDDGRGKEIAKNKTNDKAFMTKPISL